MTGVALGANRHVIMGMIQLLRPGAVLASATICLVGALLTGLANWTDVLLASGAVGLAVAASNAFNDIVDLDADRLNTPDRALPSGRVSIRAASLVCWSLASAAVLAAVFLGVGHAVTVVAVLGASAWYSLRLKKVLIVGPVVVALLLALALVFGASIDPTMSSAVAIGASEIALFTFGREILKGVRDVEGDRLMGVATVANVWGAKPAAAVFSACCAGVIVVAASSGSPTHFLVMMLLVAVPGIAGSIVWWTSKRDLSGWVISRSAWLWVSGLAGIALL